MSEIIEKYSKSEITNLNNENIFKIGNFLEKENCNFIEDILEENLDIFTIDYEVFVKKYNELNKKYNNNLLNEISNDMNLLEKFFED